MRPSRAQRRSVPTLGALFPSSCCAQSAKVNSFGGGVLIIFYLHFGFIFTVIVKSASAIVTESPSSVMLMLGLLRSVLFGAPWYAI